MTEWNGRTWDWISDTRHVRAANVIATHVPSRKALRLRGMRALDLAIPINSLARTSPILEHPAQLPLATLAKVLVGFIAVLHTWFMVLEMYFWNKPLGWETFHTTPAFATESATLAANQGLYNGFLAAGLLWSLMAREPIATATKTFFLSCVATAGLYGGMTVGKQILFIQMLPAVIALIIVRVVAAKARGANRVL